MDFIKKKIASWEIKYGQIAISSRDCDIAKKLFKDYIGTTFTIETFAGKFPNKHFLDAGRSLKLSCKPFFGQLNDGDISYLQPYTQNSIKISRDKPLEQPEKTEERIEDMKITEIIPKEASPDNLNLFVELVKENRKLREENEELIKYKDRLEKYQNLDYIFEDEKFMEDWLERNIHKALANLEIIDRQPVIKWKETFMCNKPDFFCLDKTTRELVVVENKVRGRHRTVETQFLTYSAWVKRNLEKINEEYKDKDLKATDKFKFVIIADTIDERLEVICEDRKIALVLIDGGVIFEEIVPYYSE